MNIKKRGHNNLIDTNNIIQQFLLKQTDIDKILEVIRKKVLKGTHLPLTIKEIQAGYLSSLYFKDIYLYLAQNIEIYNIRFFTI